MKKTLFGIILGLLLGAGAMWLLLAGGTPAEAPKAAADATPDAEPGHVHLETDDQESANMTTAQPTPMEYKPETKGYARVLDSSSLVAELSEIQADTAALDVSTKSLARLQVLKDSGNASAQALEAAQAAVAHDQLQLSAAKSRLLSEWGKALATRTDLSQLADALLTQDAALIRVDIPGGEALPAEPRELRVAPVMSKAEAVPVELLGPAPNADLETQGAGFLTLISKNPPPPGTQLVAFMTGSGDSQKGLRLPGSAIVRYDGDTFVYAQTNNEDFERWRVKIGATLSDGSVFITSGVTAQDHIVVTAAAQLLSEELKAATGGP